MRTVGSRIRTGERRRIICDYCGTLWDKRDLHRDAQGLWVCPQEGTGRDAITLTKANVASAKAYAAGARTPAEISGRYDKESADTAEEELQAWEPTGLPGYILNLNPYSMVTLSGGGVSCISSVVGKYNFPFLNLTPSQMPTWEPGGWVAATSGIARPSMLFDGIDDGLTCINGAGQILTGGDDAPNTIFCVAQMVTAPSGKQNTIFSTGDISRSNGPIQIFCALNGATWTSLKTSVFVSGGTPDTNKHHLDVNQTGKFVTIGVDGTTVASGAQDVPYSAVTAMTLGRNARPAVLPAVSGNVRIARVLGFASSLGASDMAYVRGKLAEIYF